MTFSVTNRTVGDVLIMDLSGRVTAGPAADEFRAALEAVFSKGHKKILLNLTDVSFVDSAGLSVFVTARVKTSASGITLKLLNIQPRIAELLRLTNLLTIFERYDNEAAALASFA